MFIQTEATPNPATLKFIPGRLVLDGSPMEFSSREAAARSPLAEKLFDVPGVTGVFYGSDFITVTKTSGEWQQLKPAILGAIMEHYMSGAPLLCRRHGVERCGFRRPRRVLRRGGCRDGRHDQGPDRDPGAAGGCQ